MGALLLDEPTSSLESRHQLLLRTLQALARAEGIAALVVPHDVNLAAQWCNRRLLLGRGRSVAQGTPAQVLTAHRLEQVHELPVTVLAHPLYAGTPLVVFSAGT